MAKVSASMNRTADGVEARGQGTRRRAKPAGRAEPGSEKKR